MAGDVNMAGTFDEFWRGFVAVDKEILGLLMDIVGGLIIIGLFQVMGPTLEDDKGLGETGWIKFVEVL